MNNFIRDLHYAIRTLLKSPRFTAVAILALAVGIGANTAIFSLISAVLLRPLPGIENPNELVSFYRIQKNDTFDNFGYPDFSDYRDRARTLSGLAAFCSTAMSVSNGTPERIAGVVVTGNYFSVLGVKAIHGRTILPSDDSERGAHPVAVISYNLWQRTFGGDPKIVGVGITLNGFPFTVTGIAPMNFSGTEPGGVRDVWVPMSMLDEAMPRTVGHHFFDERAWGWLGLFGRMKPGVSLGQVRAEMKGIAGQLEAAYPQTNSGRTIEAARSVGLDLEDRARFSRFLGMLLASVALLLLIACANVAGLLLVRATARRQEIAVRLSLGATRGQLIGMLVTEGLLLSIAGGTLGLVLAPWVTGLALELTGPSSFLRNIGPELDARVLMFTAVISIVTGVIFSLIPALQASNPNLVTALKQAAAGGGRRHSSLQRMIAGGQVAVTFLLLVGAGLAMRSMEKILSIRPGFDPDNLLTGRVDLNIQGYSGAQGLVFYRQLLARLRSAPGIVSATLAMTVPPQDWSGRVSIFHPGQEPSQDVLRGHEFELGLRVDYNPVGPDYFRTMRIPILQGRDFTSSDAGGLIQDSDGNVMAEKPGSPGANQAAHGVVIITRKLAQRLWPGQDAVGKYISWPTLVGPARPPVEVVGVAADSKYRSLVADEPLLMYTPIFQNYDGRAAVVVRTAHDPVNSFSVLRAEASAIDRNLPVSGVQTVQQQMTFSIWQQKLAAALAGAFGVLALALAALGLYGVVAQSVAQRTREMGVRMALGAGRHDIFRMVVREGMLPVVFGLAVGLPAALFGTRLVSGFVYGVHPNDPLTLILVTLLLAAVALAASWIPARHATQVDPMSALRHE